MPTNSAAAPLPMPIIVGSPRSGTTLLRLMLDAHPDLAIPPETGFLAAAKALEEDKEQFHQRITHYPAQAPAWSDFQISADHFRSQLESLDPFSAAEGYRLFYRMYASRFGKTRWGDKTPMYCRHLNTIEAILPEAHFIHLIRDGRDVSISLRERWFSPGHDIRVQADYWRKNVQTARTQGATCRRYLEVRFEDLVTSSESVLRTICSFIELEYHPDILNYHQTAVQRLQEHGSRQRLDGSVIVTQEERLRQQAQSSQLPNPDRIGLWKERLSDDERILFEEVAGELLRDLGYSVGSQD